MFLNYSKIPGSSKVWIFQTDRKFSNIEKEIISSRITIFVSVWETHNRPVYSSFKLFDYFLCIFVDESNYVTSGCSIDSLVKEIKSIGLELKLDFFNRQNLVYNDNGKEAIISIEKFKDLKRNNLKVYNNLISTKHEFENQWLVYVKDSWLKRLI
tara:strand:+ start:277 stop:741 length:465 start_codon:yes stop_codon:yes gene_type:complete